MSAHGIDVFNFEYWDGQPPTVPQQHAMAYTRPGAADVSVQLLGIWGDQFEVVLTSHWPSTLAATVGYNTMRLVVGTGWLTCKYANLNYTGLYGVGYHALNVTQVDLRVAALLKGPGYTYTNGGILVTRWTLQPEIL